MGFVLRRSLPALTGLIALGLAAGVAAVLFIDAPSWFPAVFVLGLLGLSFAINPWLIEWLVPAAVVPHDGERYLTDHVVGELVARRCRDASVPLVRLGIIDDGTPNAFTFGHHPGDARIWLTRGLLERLDVDELDAVIAHEVGHIKHWDFVIMTVAAVVPILLYLVWVSLRGQRGEAAAVGWSAYIAYWVAQLTVRALSRARELAADHWSCEITANGDALASALVKIAYGMGQVDAERKNEMAALRAEGKSGKKAAAKLERGYHRKGSMGIMGIFDPGMASAVSAAVDRGVDPPRAIAALRWDLVNPWGRTLEKLSTHPLVARRIEALDRSGLPGRPRVWSTLTSSASADSDTRLRIRDRFWLELFVAVAPWALLLGGLAAGVLGDSLETIGAALLVVGLLFLVKQSMRYPASFKTVNEITELLERLDAGPVTGIAVEVHGTLIGRGMPGYVLSPDLVIQDGSGFVPLVYFNPLPFAREWFGAFHAREFLGQEATATGWYRRGPQPQIELRRVHAMNGRSARAWGWVAHWIGSGLLTLSGIGVVVAAFASP